MPVPPAPSADSYRHRGQRRALVAELRHKGIRDEAVLAALGQVPRHLFFDPAFESHAYLDKAFPIGEGQTISQPYTVAYQTELLAVQPGQRVLEVGTGSGYQGAVLLTLGAELFTIEYQRVLFERTRQRLGQLGYHGAQLFCGDGSVGLPAHAPFDRILLTAAAPALPRPLLQQLRVGGVLVAPVGPPEQVQRMVRVTRESAAEYAREDFEEFRFVPLRGAAGWAG